MPAFTSIAAGVGAAGALAGGLGGLFGGGNSGADAAKEAAQIQAAAANRSADLQYQMYQEAVARSKPWLKAGTSAVNEYAGLLNLPGYQAVDRTDYLRSTPGYQFQMDQGVNALDRSAASRGMLLSGPQAKAVTKYGQGLADSTYNSLMDRIAGISSQGQNAAALSGNQGITTGQNMGNAYMTGANAQAQGLYNAYNARESAYGNSMNNLMGGLGMATRAAGPAISNWWNSSGGYVPKNYGSSNYYSTDNSGLYPAYNYY